MALQDGGGRGGGNAELLALHRIDETCVRLQQQGNYLEALETMERGLVLRQHFFGPASDEVWKACKTVGEMCNLLAMTYLQQEDFAMVLELLKKAEILTERDDKGRAVTYNNLACYYRRQGKLHAALQYLQRALSLEQRLPDVDNRADTHLNLCAVLSQLGRHAGALEHAQSALINLQEELFPGALSSASATGEGRKQKNVGVDRIAVLAIAYHNIGVEQEFLKRFEMALESYRKGVEISEHHLGESHGITMTLRTSFLAAKKSAATKPAAAMARGNAGAGARIDASSKKKKAEKIKAERSRSPDAALKDEERWNSIQKAYGDVALGVKPAPIVHAKYNLHSVADAREEELLASIAKPAAPAAAASRGAASSGAAGPAGTGTAGGAATPAAVRAAPGAAPAETQLKSSKSAGLGGKEAKLEPKIPAIGSRPALDEIKQLITPRRSTALGTNAAEIQSESEEKSHLEHKEQQRAEHDEAKRTESKDENTEATVMHPSERESKAAGMDGFQVSLPEGWSKQFSRSKQKEYWFNSTTGQSLWNLHDVPGVEIVPMAASAIMAAAAAVADAPEEAEAAVADDEAEGEGDGEGDGEGEAKGEDEGEGEAEAEGEGEAEADEAEGTQAATASEFDSDSAAEARQAAAR